MIKCEQTLSCASCRQLFLYVLYSGNWKHSCILKADQQRSDLMYDLYPQLRSTEVRPHMWSLSSAQINRDQDSHMTCILSAIKINRDQASRMTRILSAINRGQASRMTWILSVDQHRSSLTCVLYPQRTSTDVRPHMCSVSALPSPGHRKSLVL